ncbi:zinc-dependent metalloprotease [Chitinophaga nivalis]|uniref:Zinc-dependent metalloprotease n=1 Tax=Chitinophaga nivalis TaxID=2991709 RepID=A0ABT3II34_9BACT|nr:zinc-dependent metalloprotease [Chitinophaga nivalis]MCW3466679.1 zinc-dependent metalloprotease [Chitinophaga nivalis]MCW3483630.1 zinc-dependent metalloprotease [Chitinophaga nivalis]
MKKSLSIIAGVALAAFMMAACNKSNDNPAAPATQQSNGDKVYAYITNLGFAPSNIQDNGTEYIVEGDIIFPKNMQVPADNGKVKTEQFYTGVLVSQTNSRKIRLKVHSTMTSMSAEIDAAIAQWNAVPNCSIHWELATGTSYDVLIQDANLGAGVCGQGQFPAGGLAGALIKINKAQIAGNSFAQRQRTITHEMGHNVSFRHTNWSAIGESSATPVPGVGGTDASSIMNGGQCGSGATVLSAKDKQAAAVLYPL